MARDKTLKHIGAYVSPEKHAAIAGLGISVQDVIENAVDLYLAKGGIPVPEAGSPSSEEKLWIRKLLELLRSSDTARIQMVTFALDAHGQAERAKRKRDG